MSNGAIQTSYATADVIGYSGQLCDDSENTLITAKNADVVSMAFGSVVAFKTSSPTSDADAILPAGSTAKLMGILVQEHDYERTYSLPDGSTAGELDGTGLVPGTIMSLLVDGACYVKVQQAVVPGDRLFVCYSAGSVYTVIGQVGNADESSNTIDATKIGRFESTSSAGAIAKLRVDFSQKP